MAQESEFTRSPIQENQNIFNDDTPVDLNLRFRDDFELQYDRNENNDKPFGSVKAILNGKINSCYFQRQKEFEKRDPNTGKTSKQSNHQIIIPISEEKAVQAKVALDFNDGYSYRVIKLKEVDFFNEPIINTIKAKCKVIFRSFKDYEGFQSSEPFKDLYHSIERLEIPKKDLNKEKDKQIWRSFVDALKALVKEKEQVWKIKKVEGPYLESQDKSERASYLNIYIDEDELTKQFESDLVNMFGKQELEDWAVSDKNAFIQFKNFTEINDNKLNELSSFAEENFYYLSKESPIHSLDGEVNFHFTEEAQRLELLQSLIEEINQNYQLEIELSDKKLIIDEETKPFIEKVISDNYSSILEIKTNNRIDLLITFDHSKQLLKARTEIENDLNSEALTRHNINIDQEKSTIILDIGHYIYPTRYAGIGLKQEKAITKFKVKDQYRLKPIEGLTINNNLYEIVDASKDEAELALENLRIGYPDSFVSRLPTSYVYTLNQRNIKRLREFKLNNDIQGKASFDISTSTYSCWPEDETEYDSLLNELSEKNSDISFTAPPFNTHLDIEFRIDNEDYRIKIFNDLQNNIRKSISSDIEFDLIQKNHRLLFQFNFLSAEERDKTKNVIDQKVSDLGNLLEAKYEGVLGRTTYEFIKNETLELEREKEVAKGIRQATFVYLTPKEKDDLDQEKETKGERERYRGGINIGKLVRKNGPMLKFRLEENFDMALHDRPEDRLEIEEMKKGFIKPIFPGEITNISRMIRAMKKVTDPDNYSGFPVNRNLSNFLFDIREARISYDDYEETKEAIQQNLIEKDLNPKQLDAVTKAILAKDISLIQGPPGTGKTTVIAEIVWQTLLRDPNSRILITSQTNLAVDNAIERLSGKKLVRPLRIGNENKFEEEGKQYSISRIKEWGSNTSKKAKSDSTDLNAVSNWVEKIKKNCSTEEKYLKAVEKWKSEIESQSELIKSKFTQRYLNHVNVFAATCSECGSGNFSKVFQNIYYADKNTSQFSEPEFDLVIMDEASKATPPELVLPLTLGKKVIIIGDHKQLPPMIDEKDFSEALEAVGARKLIEDWTKEDYKTSQFEKLIENASESIVGELRIQYRMHKQIMDCINQFYLDDQDGGLKCGIEEEMNNPDLSVKGSRHHGFHLEPFISQEKHAIWVNVETPETKVGTSYENEGEIHAIKVVLDKLINQETFPSYCDSFLKEEDKEIGIITFYMPQMSRIRQLLYGDLTKEQRKNFEQFKYLNEYNIPFRINTVDRFQGMERNIVIVSTVRSDEQLRADTNNKTQIHKNTKYPYALGFAREFQRLNVALSRAKRLLIVIGNKRHFENRSDYMNAISYMHVIDIKQIENL